MYRTLALRGKGIVMCLLMMTMMMMVCVDTLVSTCVLCNPVYRTLHSTGGEGKMMMVMMMMKKMMMVMLMMMVGGG